MKLLASPIQKNKKHSATFETRVRVFSYRTILCECNKVPLGKANKYRLEHWQDLEVRVLYCDRSIWDSVQAGWWVQAQTARAHAEGRPMRNVKAVRFRGANHFVSRRSYYCSFLPKADYNCILGALGLSSANIARFPGRCRRQEEEHTHGSLVEQPDGPSVHAGCRHLSGSS